MITLAQWRQQGELESINGQQIFTRTGGDKSAPALVLIHGYPSASWDWEGMWQALTQRYYVITLDMLGFGFSAKPIAVFLTSISKASVVGLYPK